ncbi:MAG TPA: YfcC family protein [Actinomycetes bacterium]|nr:YfcC family protein [Actinomycetes bacterium]
MADQQVRAEPVEHPEKRRRFTLPSAYTILFALIVLMAIATWLVPAGVYDRDKEGAPIPGTYHEVDQNPQRILIDSITAPINGLYGIEDEAGNINYYNSGVLFGAIDVALFIIVIGGFLGVTMQTGAIQAGISRLVRRLRGRERWMIPILMGVFALGGTTYGMAEESLAFYALVITVMIAAGYDALVGAAVLLLGCGIGTLGSTLNPFATGIASGFAGVSISEGIVGRLVILLVGLAIGIWFVLRYADRVKRDPAASVVHDLKEENEARFRATEGEGDVQVLTGKHKVILAVFGLAFVVMMYGVIPWEDLGVGLPTLWWWFPEMTASFLLFAVVIGLIGRMSEGRLTGSFIDGARDLLGVALIIGIARGITVVMNNGQITDTVLHWAELALGDVGKAAFSIVMYGLFLPLSFLIPSSSGLATVSMPIMAPLAGFVGVPKDLVVTAYQSASGLMNLFIPTSAVVMGGLAIARVPYGRYLRWVWPLLALLAALTVLVLAAGALLS